MEPLVFKIETQADDSGVRKYEKSIGGLDVSSKKASSALKSFAHDIAQARDGADVASATLGAFSRILGSSLAATGIIIAVKTVVDGFTKIDQAVKESEKAVADAFAGMEKAGEALSFAEAVSQAKTFENTAYKIREEIKKINESPMLNIIDGLMQSTDRMRELAKQSEDQGIAIRKAGAESELAYLSRIASLDAEGKALAANERALQKELEGINLVKEASTALSVTKKYEIQANEIIQKQIEERRKKETEATDASRKNAMNEFQFEIDSRNRKTEAESKAFFEKLERDKKVLEQVKKIEEAEQKLNDLIAKRAELEDAVLKAKQNQTLRQGELSTMTAGIGGSLRGLGQRKTSSEIGINRAGERAYQNEINRQAERYDQGIAEDLYIQKSLEGLDPRVSKSEIQNEKQRRVENAAREKAKKQFEDSTQKNKDKATGDLKRNQIEIDKQKGEVSKLKKEMGIGDIHDLLSKNLEEMRTYALVK